MALTLNDLKPDPKNPRQIAPDNLERLGKMIGVYGDLANITWNQRTGTLVGGHQRMNAISQKYGEENMRVVEITSENGTSILLSVTDEHGKEITFPIRIVDWDEPTAHAAMIAANSKDVQGTFDWKTLSMQIQEFGETFGAEFDPTMFGLSDDTLAPLIAAEWSPPPIKEDATNPNADNMSGEVSFTLTFDAFRWSTIQAACGTMRKEPEFADKSNEELVEKIVDSWLTTNEVVDTETPIHETQEIPHHADQGQRLGDGPA